MFFAPPKVKSLSRYAEFGSYLDNRHFLIMLAIAITAHLGVIGIYSMVPHEQVIRIPVRALNIKLTGGSSGNGIHMPHTQEPAKSAPMHEIPPAADEDTSTAHESTAEMAMDDALAAKAPGDTHTKIEPLKSNAPKGMFVPKEKAHHKITPKKYVRSNEAQGKSHSKNGTGNGSDMPGVKGGDEVVSRYTQVVSQWIMNHQSMAKAACGEAKEVTGQCNAKGEVTVRLRISREGAIISNTIEHSSGSELVDQAATMMVRSSDPVPSVPGDYPSDSQLEFLIAVQVDLSKQ